MPLSTSTTGNDLLEIAYAKLMDVSPDRIATEGTELLTLINRAITGCYAFAARINPLFFGERAAVPYEVDLGWLRPQNAESVFRIEDPDGAEVAVLPIDQKNQNPGEPTVYELGQYYRSTGEDLSPVGGNLNVFYSRRPVLIDDLEDEIDVAWPEAFNELLGLEIAMYLAMKAGMNEELGPLKGERDGWAARFSAFLQHSTANTRRAWSTRFRLVDAMTVLA